MQTRKIEDLRTLVGHRFADGLNFVCANEHLTVCNRFSGNGVDRGPFQNQVSTKCAG